LGLGVIGAGYAGAGPLLDVIGVDPGFRGLTVDYVHAMVLGAPAICVFLAFRFTTEGIGYTTPMMYLSLFGLACNVFLNWVFMFRNTLHADRKSTRLNSSHVKISYAVFCLKKKKNKKKAQVRTSSIRHVENDTADRTETP